MNKGLYIVATPIGNLGDITARAIETLNNSDFIICENPKHSLRLLSKFGIKKKLISLHDHNEGVVIKKIEKDLKNKIISLISDAGSPLISDPGFKLVKFCIENDFYTTVVPGPSSLVSALQLSSIASNKFIFQGFLPKSKKAISEIIETIKNTEQTSILFVSTHKIILFLEMLAEIITNKKIAVCKEMTKMNEKLFIGEPRYVLNKINEKSSYKLGEFVVVIEGNNIKKTDYSINYDTNEAMRKLLKKFSLTDTVEIVHKIGNIGKKELYNVALSLKNEK